MAAALHVPTPSATEGAEPARDLVVSRLGERQHGLVTLAQLAAAGLGASGARRRVAGGRLHRVHRGVYAVGHPLLSAEGRLLAAALACGHAAAVSHRSAAAVLDLRRDDRARVDVTTPGRARRQRPGIVTHGGVLDARDVTSVGAIPCTTVARTLVDLAGEVTRRELERACERAEQLRVFDLGELMAALDRAGPRPGVPALRSLLGEGLGETHTRSELEERFLELCRSAGLPRPQPNARLGVLEVDFLWSAQRLVVETDGRAVHGTPQAFERDRDRDRRLLLAGYRVVRFTWRQVTGTPEVVAETVRALLASPA